MKCCGSPTISIARNEARDVAAAFNALLVGEAFKPLAKAMGFYGDTVVGLAVRALTRAEHGGMTDHLARAIEATAQHDLTAAAHAL